MTSKYPLLDIEERLRMERHMLTAMDGGLPDDDTELIKLIYDAYWYVHQAKRIFGIPENWVPPKEG